MSNFIGVGIFWIGLNRADLGCWRLTLTVPNRTSKGGIDLSLQSPEFYGCIQFEIGKKDWSVDFDKL